MKGRRYAVKNHRVLARVLPLVLVESLLASLGLIAFAPGPASAAPMTFTVNTTTDNSTCNAGTCSLRGAVLAADGASNATTPVTINIPAGTYNLTLGELDIDATNGNITLNGTSGSPASVVINQTSKTGGSPGVNNIVALVAFNLSNSSLVTGQSTTFQNLTVQGGVDTRAFGGGGGGGFGGGGIQVDGGAGNSLTITNCVFSGNKSAPDGAGGGGIFDGAGSLTVSNSTFTGNTSASGFGGGIGYSDTGLAAGDVSITNSTFTSNTVTAAPGASDAGGGAFIGGATITQHATVSGSTFSGNSAGADGGGLYIAAELSTSVTTSQFVNNTAGTVVAGRGGGVYMTSTNPTTSAGSGSITLSSFTGNIASNGGLGGAILNDIGPTVVNHNRIVGNTAGTGRGVAEDVSSGSVNVDDNWWGVNSGPVAGTFGAATVTPPATAPSATSWLQLRNVASPATVPPGGAATFTADLLGRNTGGPLASGTLNGLPSFPTPPGVFSNPVDVTTGTVSGQFVNGVATAAVTAGLTLGPSAGQLDAVADNQLVTGDLNIKADSATAIATSPSTSVFGQPVTFTATLTSLTSGTTPAVPQGGTVTFAVDGLNVGTAMVSNGTATINDASMAVGSHTVTASYGGDSDFNSSATEVGATQTVNKADTSVAVASSLNPSVFTQSVKFTATITAVAPGAGTPGGTGSVQFQANGTNLGSAVTPVNGVATFSTSSLSPGSYTITAIYAGDGNFNGSTGTLSGQQVVNPEPPAITKSFGAATVPLNGTTSLTFTITNPVGNGVATGIAFTDTLPSGLVVSTPNGATGACGGSVTATPGAGTVSLSGGTLADGGSCTVSVNVTATVAGAQNNSVSVSSTGGGTGNTSNASVTVVAPPTVSKSFSPSTILINGTSVLSFTIGNPNTGQSLSGVALTDPLPGGVQVAATPGVSVNCGSGVVTATAGASTIALTGGTIPASGMCTFSVHVTGTTTGSWTNTTGTVSSTEGGTGGTAMATLIVTAEPVSIVKSFGAATIPLNGTTSLSFTISNPAGNGPASGIAFTDTLPSGLLVSTPNGASGVCGGSVTATPGAGTVSLAGGTLADGGTCTVSVNVTGLTAGVQNNSVSVSSTEGGTGNTSNASVTVVAPPTISKSFNPTMVALNGTASLIITITNPAANTVALSGIGFTDTLPSGLVVATPNILSTSCGAGVTATAGSGSVSLSGAALSPGPVSSCTVSLNVTGTTAGAKNNSVTVTSTNGGTGNTSMASVTVVAPPTISKVFGAASIPQGGTTSLTFTLANPSDTVALSGVGFTDTLPAGLVVAAPNGLTGTCGTGTVTATAGSSTVALSGGTLAAGGSCSFSLNVTGVAAGTKVNTTGNVTSTEGGTGLTATATLVVVAPPVIAKAFGAANIALNGSTSLMFTVTNPAVNTVAETGVAFTDTLPSGLVVATPNGLSAQSGCGTPTITATAGAATVSLSGGTIGVGGTCTFSVNVTGTTNGTKNNSVTVSSTNGGTGNTAMATLNVALPPVIVKSFGVATIPMGGSTALTFMITNPNSSFALTGVAFTDTLPAGLVVSTPNGLTGSCGGGSITAVAGTGTVTLSGATLAGAATCSFSVNVTSTTAGVENNSVSVTSGNAGPGNMSSATVTVLAPPTISKTFGMPAISFGQNTTLTFTLSNPNTTNSLTGIGFTDTLPAGLVVATPNALSGSCGGGTITATAGSGQIGLSGATLAASASCNFSVAVTAVGVGDEINTTSAVTSTNGGTGGSATATLTVTRAPTTTTVTATPANPTFGQPVTFTATVVPSGPNNSGMNPTGTVSFYLNGSSTPIATVMLNAAGQAAFTTAALAAGTNTVTASYSGDTNFLPSSSSTGATTTVSCANTVTGANGALVPSATSTCVIGGTISGSIVLGAGQSLDLEGVTVVGSITVTGGGSVRICGSTIGGSVTVQGDTSFVVIGDAADGCAPNTIGGGLTLLNNHHGVQAIGNTVKGAVNTSGNSGAGPFPDDTSVNISGNGH